MNLDNGSPGMIYSRSRVVAIHQPDFFPWMGFFNKIARSDNLILMDNVQFAKTGSGTWTNRVRVVVNRQAAWITVPIVRAYHGTRTIREMQINNATPWRDKLLKTLQFNYGRAPFFKTMFPLFQELVNYATDSLAEFNIVTIRAIVQMLGFDPDKQIIGTELNVCGKATDLLIDMTKAVGGIAYMCGGGAADYQEDEKFALAGLELIYQNFQHPIYPQFNTDKFIPGLSIIDVLMNCGFEHTKELLVSQQNVLQLRKRYRRCAF